MSSWQVFCASFLCVSHASYVVGAHGVGKRYEDVAVLHHTGATEAVALSYHGSVSHVGSDTDDSQRMMQRPSLGQPFPENSSHVHESKLLSTPSVSAEVPGLVPARSALFLHGRAPKGLTDIVAHGHALVDTQGFKGAAFGDNILSVSDPQAGEETRAVYSHIAGVMKPMTSLYRAPVANLPNAPAGMQGPPGAAGLTVPQPLPPAPRGPPGIPGVRGPMGYPGEQGAQGDPGSPGGPLSGPEGHVGPKGGIGAMGMPGPRGIMGGTGPKGPSWDGVKNADMMVSYANEMIEKTQGVENVDDDRTERLEKNIQHIERELGIDGSKVKVAAGEVFDIDHQFAAGKQIIGAIEARTRGTNAILKHQVEQENGVADELHKAQSDVGDVESHIDEDRARARKSGAAACHGSSGALALAARGAALASLLLLG